MIKYSQISVLFFILYLFFVMFNFYVDIMRIYLATLTFDIFLFHLYYIYFICSRGRFNFRYFYDCDNCIVYVQVYNTVKKCLQFLKM